MPPIQSNPRLDSKTKLTKLVPLLHLEEQISDFRDVLPLLKLVKQSHGTLSELDRRVEE
jgi:hypothetical protein